MYPKTHAKFVSLYITQTLYVILLFQILISITSSSCFIYIPLKNKLNTAASNHVWKRLWAQRWGQQEARSSYPDRRRWLCHCRSACDLPVLGHHKAIKAELRPPGCYALHIQPLCRFRAGRPHHKPASHDIVEKSQRQDWYLLRKGWHLRVLPEPTDNSSHITSCDLPGSQRYHRLVAVSVRRVGAGGAVRCCRSEPGPECWNGAGEYQSWRESEMEGGNLDFRKISLECKLSGVYYVRRQDQRDCHRSCD